jgi:2-dehydro-3-deoxyphosphogluconate aldolase / (4S)-4-hydroxy-2-oxoglutarate aldolase
MTVLDIVAQHKIVAIIRLDDLSTAQQITDALIDGGIRAIEFTLTHPDAVKTIGAIRNTVDDTVVIGAGSVISVEQVKAVADVGAQFVVSPNTNPSVIQACVDLGLPAMPGALTPTEIQMAWELGASVVKVFPAHHFDARYIKDVRAPLPHLRLMPTGGINVDNIRQYLDYGAFGVGIGSTLINKSAVENQDWATLTNHARQFVDKL